MEAIGHSINIGKINYNIFLSKWPAGHLPKAKNWGRGQRAEGPFPLPQTPTPNPIYVKN